MGQLEDLKLFVSVVQNRGISRAADQLGIAKSAVSRRLSGLEHRYQAKLVERGPARWDITETGEELYGRALRVIGEADEMDADFARTPHSLEGPLSVALPDIFGRSFLMPTVLRFRAEHPRIQLNVDFDDRQSDLLAENYDLAVRLTDAPHESLVARLLGHTRHALFASRDYVSTRGIPTTLDDLSKHPLLYFGTKRRARWVFETPSGTQSISFQPSVSSNSGEFLLGATLAGEGIARMPDFLARDHLARGELVHVLPEAQVAQWGIYLIRAGEKRMNPRMRRFAEYVEQACALA